MEGHHRVVRQGKALKPGAGVHRHQRPPQRGREALQHIGDDHRVANGDAHGTGQRQPAHKGSPPPQSRFPARPGHLVGAQGAGAGPAAHGVFGGKPHGAKKQNKNQVGHQEGAAAVAAHLGREPPHVSHSHRGAYCRKDKPPAAGKLPVLLFCTHKKPSYPLPACRGGQKDPSHRFLVIRIAAP